jgi:hypothetical protein
MRHGRPSPRRTPVAEVERIPGAVSGALPGFNGRHFWQLVRGTTGEALLQLRETDPPGAGMLKKGRLRGRHRRRRERKGVLRGRCCTWTAVPHRWVERGGRAAPDAHPGYRRCHHRLLYAQLSDGETVQAVMSALRDVFGTYGIPHSLLYGSGRPGPSRTLKAGEKVSQAHLTQVGQALERLGVRHIPSYSPQARGRSERMNRTLQDRLVNEFRVARVRTIEQANAYLREHYIARHNEFLARSPEDPQSAFGPRSRRSRRDPLRRIGATWQGQRGHDGRRRSQIAGNRRRHVRRPPRRSCAAPRRGYSVRRGVQIFGRYDRNGWPVEAAGPVESRKRTRFPTRTLDAGKRRRRPQLPQAPAAANL